VNHSNGTPCWENAFELYWGDVWFISAMKKVRNSTHTFGEAMLVRFRQSFSDVVNHENVSYVLATTTFVASMLRECFMRSPVFVTARRRCDRMPMVSRS
jgi:hypothetical protein